MFIIRLVFYLFIAASVESGVLLERSTQFKSIFAFGDSYTDNGSFKSFYESGLHRIDESSLHPSTTTTLKRSSDGPLWIEHLSHLMGDIELYDFARSGSTANNELIFRGTQDMNTQVHAYLDSKVSLKPKNESIYFLWTGVNDINDLFSKYPEDTIKRRQILDGVIDSIEGDIQLLRKAGARYVMFLGLVPLETLPMYHDKEKTELVSLIDNYNARLAGMKDVYFFDTNTVFKSLFTPEEIKRNSVEHCQSGENCDEYIWWDKLHPSSKTHELIAQAVYKKVKELDW